MRRPCTAPCDPPCFAMHCACRPLAPVPSRRPPRLLTTLIIGRRMMQQAGTRPCIIKSHLRALAAAATAMRRCAPAQHDASGATTPSRGPTQGHSTGREHPSLDWERRCLSPLHQHARCDAGTCRSVMRASSQSRGTLCKVPRHACVALLVEGVCYKPSARAPWHCASRVDRDAWHSPLPSRNTRGRPPAGRVFRRGETADSGVTTRAPHA